MGQKRKGSIHNTFEKGMWLDSLHSLQPQGTYREAWAVTNKSDDENRYGVSNEAANTLHVELPKGAIVRSMLYIEERNYFISFLRRKGGKSEIGIIDEVKKEYRKVVDDGDLPEPLNFSDTEWNALTYQVLQPCNQLYIYWSNADYYYRLNIDDPCKEWKTRPIRLMKEHCVAPPVITIMDGGGGGLPNGIYQAFVQLRDQDGNTTNWFKIGQPVPIGQGYEGDNIAGENSGKAINIKVEDIHQDYGIVNIGIHSVIGGISSTNWVDTVAYGKGVMDYYYRGITGKEIPISIADVISRKNMYIRGSNLTQYDGRLVLYNLRANHNIDWQRQVNDIKWYWQIWAMPVREAHKYKGLRPNENYWFGIHENYVDSTRSADFAGIGKDGSNAAMVRLPGCDCEVPIWEVTDTTVQTKVYCSLADRIKNSSKTPKLENSTDNEIVTEYVLKDGKVEEDNHTNSSNGDESLKEMNDENEKAKKGSDQKSSDRLKCICEKYREVLIDAEKLSGGDLEKSTRWVGMNRKEAYDLGCACDELVDDKGDKVYPDNTFHDLIIKIVE